MKTCSFLHVDFTETMKIVENLFLKSIENTYVYLQHMLLKIRKTILKFTFIPSIMSIVFAPFKHLKLPIGIKMPVTTACLCLHDSYSSELEFMNYFLANPVVAWW